EQLNINFIFSDDDSRQSQWQYIYSRLPYLLDYAFALILAVFSSFREPEQVTQDYTELPVLSAGLLWHRSVPEALRTEHLDLHSSKLRELLVTVCTGEGLEIPNDADLHDLRDFGRYAP